ncbi:MAG: 30S ribosomal protein S6 [Candidatus Gastranaerophilales bacterium]|nr:30S ribosomal protein S6 [Candidatus Gastranaerophilales bacterium]
MRNYEILCIIKPNLDMEEADKVVDALEATIKDFGGKIEGVDKMGRKKLAYEINNFKDGFYLNLKIDFPEEKVVELKRNLTLNDNVLRFMLLESKKAKA